MNWDPTVAVIVAAVGAVLLLAIYLFGRPGRSAQGRRNPGTDAPWRREPSLDGSPAADDELGTMEAELARLDRALETPAAAPDAAERRAGERAQSDFDKIVSLFVQAPEGSLIRGAELVVAAEKAGLTFGAMNIFHRLVDGRPEQGPVFSVANMVKPGSFDLSALDSLQTPGISFFMTLPGPLPGLDAWETMLPAAQRMAELLDAQVLDDRRNPIGRQRIAHLRDELRAYDRSHEAQPLRGGW